MLHFPAAYHNLNITLNVIYLNVSIPQVTVKGPFVQIYLMMSQNELKSNCHVKTDLLQKVFQSPHGPL